MLGGGADAARYSYRSWKDAPSRRLENRETEHRLSSFVGYGHARPDGEQIRHFRESAGENRPGGGGKVAETRTDHASSTRRRGDAQTELPIT